MEKNKLIMTINWFYALEISQGELYLGQARKSNDEYIANVLLKIAETEIKHAESFHSILNKLDTEPYKIDHILSFITGHIPATITPLIGTVNFFYYNYILESLAISEYKELIAKIEPSSALNKELLKVLVENLIDEDFHRIWFRDRRNSLLGDVHNSDNNI